MRDIEVVELFEENENTPMKYKITPVKELKRLELLEEDALKVIPVLLDNDYMLAVHKSEQYYLIEFDWSRNIEWADKMLIWVEDID